MEDDQQKHLVYTAMVLSAKYSVQEVRRRMYEEFPDASEQTIEGVIEEMFYLLHRFR